MERIGRTEHVMNGEVLHRVSEKRRLISIITERQAKWIVYVLYRDSLLRDIIEGRISGKRPS